MLTSVRSLTALLVVVGGCTPNLPLHFAETAEVLRAREAQVTGAAGLGGNASCCFGGAGLRVRVGVGGAQEVGAEGSMLFTKDGVLQAAGKLSWKLGLTDFFAVVAGAGVAWGPGDRHDARVYGFDLAAIGTAYAKRAVSLYGGIRWSAVFPFAADLRSDTGSAATAIAAVGIAGHLAPSVRLFVEVGGFDTWRFDYDSGYQERGPRETQSGGGYGAIALAWTFVTAP